MLAMKIQPTRSKAEPPTAEKAIKPSQTKAEPVSNPAWMRLSLGIQPKLTVGAPHDPLEKEADAVAERVMRIPEPHIQRQCAACAAGGAPCPKCEEEQSMVSAKGKRVSLNRIQEEY